jgi:hypothetical protein
LKNFSGVLPPDPRSRGGEEGRTEGKRRGLGTQMGRRGVVWDREGEEGMRVIQRKGMGKEEGKGRKDKDDLAPPPKKIPGSATDLFI